MHYSIGLFAISIFGIFIGTQITEGSLLLPYWKTLASIEFYEYYARFGKEIGRFYTIITIVAALIPLILSLYCLVKKSNALGFALLSLLFAVAFIAVFYIYFKGTNAQFYNAGLNDAHLKAELMVWGYWHWFRVVLEFLSLLFLILALNMIYNVKNITNLIQNQ